MPLEATDDDLLDVVEQWIALLATGRYQDAHAFLAHAPGDHWTPNLLQTVIENYGSLEPWPDGRRFRVTPTLTAHTTDGHTPYQDVNRDAVPTGLVALIHFDLPLNGEWSDLTAILEVIQEGDSLVLHLGDLHVL